MRTLIRLAAVAGLVLALVGLGVPAAAPADASASNPARLVLDPPNGSGVLSGHVENITPDLSFVTLTLTLRDGSNQTLNVDPSTGWYFSFGVLPADGWVSIALTENPIPMPTMVGDQWDYGYLHGYFYPYPYDWAQTPWSNFPGYAYPQGYGWGDYPFGYYAYPQYLSQNYSMPYFWDYAPIAVQPSYTYYGIAGLPQTFVPPSYGYDAFGTITQPYFVQNYPMQGYNPYFSLPNPVLIPNAEVAPYLTQPGIYTQPTNPAPSYTVPMPPNVNNTPGQIPGTNLWQGNGGTPNVPVVNLPNYAIPTPSDPSQQPGTNLWQGNGANQTPSVPNAAPSVPQVNMPQYAPNPAPPAPAQPTNQTPTQPGTNLWQGSGSTPSVPQVNIPQYAPAAQPTPVPGSGSVQNVPGTNLWQGSGSR